MCLRIEEIKYDDEEVLKLKVSNLQKDFIEDIPSCMEEVKRKSYGISWHPMGIFDKDTIIGFAMYGKSKDGRVWLDRFMIGDQFQRKGYGRKALRMIIELICLTMNCKNIFLSVHPENHVAIELYKKNNFSFIDELDGNAPVMQWTKPTKNDFKLN